MNNQASKSRTRHPAKYTNILLPVFAEMLKDSKRILDPMAGTGKIFDLERWLPNAEIQAIEIEPEWAEMHPKTTLGNALYLPWEDSFFDAICVSCPYGNRMADHHEAKDASRRNTYRHALGRALHAENSGAMQWGEQYKAFHMAAWAEARRVLCGGGHFILNIKDHIRKGQRVRVTDWHCEALTALGFVELKRREIECPGQRQGANGHMRIDYESVILFEKGNK